MTPANAAAVPFLEAVPAGAAPVPAGEAVRIWRELAGGQCQVLVATDHAGARHVVLVRRGERDPRLDWSCLSARDTRIVALASRGVPQKVIAIDLRLAASTVSQALRAARDRLGLSSLAELTRAYRAHAGDVHPAPQG
jgi:DNA-binding NarL/FixJ family response regulator